MGMTIIIALVTFVVGGLLVWFVMRVLMKSRYDAVIREAEKESEVMKQKKLLEVKEKFLHQDTAILTGPERIARKLNLPVIFLDTQKVKRGYYTVDMKLITENPKETPENYITERYARLLEKMILRDPAYWLWTHKRWKHKHEQQG